MALTDSEIGGGNGMIMPVAPMGYGYAGNNGGGFGGFGGDGWWIILLFILLGNGWGNGIGNNGAVPFVAGAETSAVQRGFDQNAVMSGINDITGNICNGFSNVQQSLCNGFAGVNATINGAAANAETAANARAMANMQQMFGMSSQLADCCCENRLATANLTSVVQRENCEDRYAVAQNTRDIIENANRNNQAILDKLCALEIDAKNDKINDLERQLTLANLNASQTAQTAAIRAGQVEEIDAMYNRLKSCPVPSMPVYGNQPIFTNTAANGCGCGCGSF